MCHTAPDTFGKTATARVELLSTEITFRALDAARAETRGLKEGAPQGRGLVNPAMSFW
jgi:hypothetical protein